MFQPGQVLAGKYRVERVLGQGGMGVVLAAWHINLEERVAIKLMLEAYSTSSEAVGRFVREARAAARLESSHVARVSDVGTLEDGRPYMVMEYLDGQDLGQLLAASGPLPIIDAVDYVLQASEAIAEAHSIGIIHRDLKPANLFLTRRRDRTPHVKVLDFGISKVAAVPGSSSDNAMTKTSALMGSPLYMSPEQMTSSRDVDARSDIWALGVILYELLVGTQPFVADTLPQVCGLVLQTEPQPPQARRSEVPSELNAVVLRCLAKSPAARYQSVTELAMALRGLSGRHGRASINRIMRLSGADDEHIPAPPSLQAEASVQAKTAPGHSTNATWGETRPGTPKRSSLPVVLVALLVPLLAGGGFVLLRQRANTAALSASAAPSTLAAAPSPVAAPIEPAPVAVAPTPVPTPSAAPVESAAPVAVKPAAARAPARIKPAPAVVERPAAPVAAPVAAAPAKPVAAPVEAKPKPVGLGGRL